MIAFILIYLISFAIHLLIEYREDKRFIHNVGDLIDNIRFYMWFPIAKYIYINSCCGRYFYHETTGIIEIRYSLAKV